MSLPQPFLVCSPPFVNMGVQVDAQGQVTSSNATKDPRSPNGYHSQGKFADFSRNKNIEVSHSDLEKASAYAIRGIRLHTLISDSYNIARDSSNHHGINVYPMCQEIPAGRSIALQRWGNRWDCTYSSLFIIWEHGRIICRLMDLGGSKAVRYSKNLEIVLLFPERISISLSFLRNQLCFGGLRVSLENFSSKRINCSIIH